MRVFIWLTISKYDHYKFFYEVSPFGIRTKYSFVIRSNIGLVVYNQEQIREALNNNDILFSAASWFEAFKF